MIPTDTSQPVIRRRQRRHRTLNESYIPRVAVDCKAVDHESRELGAFAGRMAVFDLTAVCVACLFATSPGVALWNPDFGVIVFEVSVNFRVMVGPKVVVVGRFKSACDSVPVGMIFTSGVVLVAVENDSAGTTYLRRWARTFGGLCDVRGVQPLLNVTFALGSRRRSTTRTSWTLRL